LEDIPVVMVDTAEMATATIMELVDMVIQDSTDMAG
jgi:hypothetical protein